MSYLAQTDLVVVLRDGEVSEAGTYQQLIEKKGAFAEFLLHHLSDAERTSPEGNMPLHFLLHLLKFETFCIFHLRIYVSLKPIVH